MKTSFKLLLVVAVATASFSIYSCSSTKSLPAATGAKKLETPLSGVQYQSDFEKGVYREKGSSNSIDAQMARDMAIQNAKVNLARQIETQINGVFENFNQGRQSDKAKDFESKKVNLSKEIVSQTLKRVRTIGEETYQEQDGTYTVYIAVEKSVNDVKADAVKSLSEDEALKVDFDKAQFEKSYNEEIEKYKKERAGK